MKLATKCPHCDAKIGFEFSLSRAVTLEPSAGDTSDGPQIPNLARYEFDEIETRIVRCMLEGMEDEDIAKAIGFKRMTIRNIFSLRIYPKVGVNSRTRLIFTLLSPTCN